jgi:hypothetical protein
MNNLDISGKVIIVEMFLALLFHSTLSISAEQSVHPSPRISLGSLRNADYGDFALRNGEYVDDLEHVKLLEELIAFGDLDGDGDDDAVVVLKENAGGTGFWRRIELMRNDNGIPLNIADFQFGDRDHVESLTILANQILVRARIHGPTDALCCPSKLVLITLVLRKEHLDLVDIAYSPSSD